MSYFLLLTLLAVCAGAAELKNCRQSRDASASSTLWDFDGHGGISASTDQATTGKVKLTCRVRLPEPVRAVRVAHDLVLVSFLSAQEKTTGDGVTIDAGSGSGVQYLRVAGEDWIESRRRDWVVELERPAREVVVTITLIDTSPRVPVRVDIRGLRVEGVGR